MMISERSPTRVDLAGGTLDMWPLYNFVGGATTVNLAIDIWTECHLEPRGDLAIEANFSDIGYSHVFKNADVLLADKDPRAHLLQILVKHFRPHQGFSIQTKSQSPVGGGLGGSSSLMISLLKAFFKFTKQILPGLNDLVLMAHNLEAELLNTPTGTQDYVPAVTGGVNIITYAAQGMTVQTLSPKGTDLEKNFMLIYTGKSHHSGLNNFEVLKSAVGKNPQTLSALGSLKEVAMKITEACHKKAWDEIPSLFDLEIKFRLQLAPAFSSPEIEELHHLTLKSGASAVKICGAGGGGCVLVWCAPKFQNKVKEECEKRGFQILAARPVDIL